MAESLNLVSSLPEVAVVILNWNGKHYLQQFLPSVMASTYPSLRVVIADNASTDDSVIFLQQTFPNIEIITLSENLGFAGGYNAALQKVNAPYYVLLNSDVEVTRDWIEPMIDLLTKDDRIAACQPKILSFANKQMFEYAGASGGMLDLFGYPFARGRIFDSIEKDEGQYDDAIPCFWASGAALCIKAAAFHAAGGFDNVFFAHQEEIDLCWRLQKAGLQIYVVPAAVVYHVGGGTLPTGSKQKVFLNFRNNLLMMYKNLPLVQLFYILPFRLLLDAVAAYKAMFEGNSSYFFAVAKAHVFFTAVVLSGKVKRTPVTDKKVAIGGVYKGSIVWQYFIKKRRNFSEIINLK